MQAPHFSLECVIGAKRAYVVAFMFALWASVPSFAPASAAVPPGDLSQQEAGLQNDPPLAPALIEFARSHNITINGISIAKEGTPSRAGDCVILVVTQIHGHSNSQWLVKIEADDLSVGEQGRLPSPDTVHYTSTGRELRYSTTLTALRVYFIGPFASDRTSSQEQLAAALSHPARVLVSQEHLHLGLYPYCQASLLMAQRMKKAGFTNLYHLGSAHPLSQEQLDKGRPFAAIITQDEEQATFGAYFALKSFLDTSRSIKSFDDLLNRTMAKPSVWATLARLGSVDTFLNYDCRDVRRVDGRLAGIDLPTYELPIDFSMNGKLALKTTLVVTSPRVPLQTCAGIISLSAEHPSDKSKRLIIRVMASEPSH